MSLLATLIAREEGYYIAGSLPNRQNNPGDLRHSAHSLHDPSAPNAIGKIDTPAHGWADLERQLGLFAERGDTLAQAIGVYAPPAENDTGAYLKFICDGLGVSVDAAQSLPMSAALQITGAQNA